MAYENLIKTQKLSSQTRASSLIKPRAVLEDGELTAEEKLRQLAKINEIQKIVNPEPERTYSSERPTPRLSINDVFKPKGVSAALTLGADRTKSMVTPDKAGGARAAAAQNTANYYKAKNSYTERAYSNAPAASALLGTSALYAPRVNNPVAPAVSTVAALRTKPSSSAIEAMKSARNSDEAEMDAYLKKISSNANKAVADDRNTFGKAAVRQTVAGVANVLPTLAETVRDTVAASRERMNAKRAGENAPSPLSPVNTGDKEMDDYLKAISGNAQKATERSTAVPAGKTGLEGMQKFADTLAADAQAEIAKSKEGKSKVEQTLIDIGVAGIQLAGDVAVAAATGGSSLPFMTLRSFGSAAQEARQNGADAIEQTLYGMANAAVEVLTEKLFGGNTLMKKAYGGGIFDGVVSKLMGKAGGATGQLVARGIKSVLEEGGEEFIASMLNPVISSIYDDKALANAFGTSEAFTTTLSNALYDGMVGGVLGFAGFGVNISNEMRDVQRQLALKEVEQRVNLTELAKEAGGEIQVMVNALVESQNYAHGTETRALGRDLNSALQELIETKDSEATRRFFKNNRENFDTLVKLMEVERDQIVPPENDPMRNGTVERLAAEENAVEDAKGVKSEVKVMDDAETRVYEALTAQGMTSSEAADVLETVTRIVSGDTTLSNNELINKARISKDKRVRAAINNLTDSQLDTRKNEQSASAAKSQMREIIDRIAAQRAAAQTAPVLETPVVETAMPPVVEVPAAPTVSENSAPVFDEMSSADESTPVAKPAVEAEIQPRSGSVKSEGYVYSPDEIRSMAQEEGYTEAEAETLLKNFGEKAAAEGIDPVNNREAFIRYSVAQENAVGVRTGNVSREQQLSADILRTALSDKGVKDVVLVSGSPSMLGVDGYYENGVVYINADRVNNQTYNGIAWTVGHEIVHHAERAGTDLKKDGVTVANAPIVNEIFEAMQQLAETGAISGEYAKVATDGDAMQQLIQRKIEAYVGFYTKDKVDANGETVRGMSEEEARRMFNEFDARAEIAADFLGTLMGVNVGHASEGRIGTKYGTADLLAMMDEAKPGVLGKIRDFVVELRDKLKSIAGGTAAERKAKANTQRMLTKLSRTLGEAMEKAGESEGEVRNSADDYILNDSERQWNAQVNSVINGSMPSHSAMYFKETPEILQELGLFDLPLTITQKHFKAALNGTNPAHPDKISESTLKQLPRLIREPVAVIGSNTDPTGAIMIVTSARDEAGKPVVVVIRPEGNAEVVQHKGTTNHILTIYGANHLHTQTEKGGMSTLERAASKGEVLYINKKRSQELYQADGLQLPRALGSLDFDTIIRKWNGYVKKEAPKREAKNVFTGETIKWSADDSDGNELSPEQQEYFKDSKVRDENGNLKVMYHGTKSFGFTVFDPSYSDDGRSLFFSDSPTTAESYSGTTRNRSVIADDLNPHTAPIEDVVRAYNELFHENAKVLSASELKSNADNLIRNNQENARFVVNLAKNVERLLELTKIEGERADRARAAAKHYETPYKMMADAQDSESLKEAADIMELVANLSIGQFDYDNPFFNMLPRDGWPYVLIQNAREAANTIGWREGKETVIRNRGHNMSHDAIRQAVASRYDEDVGQGNYTVYLNITNPLVINANGRAWNEILVPKPMREEFVNSLPRGEYLREAVPMLKTQIAEWEDELRTADESEKTFINEQIGMLTSELNAVYGEIDSLKYTTTRELAAYAQKKGYDGVLINDVFDMGEELYDEEYSNIAIAFSSEQVKDVHNSTPTTDPDIRFSVDDSKGAEKIVNKLTNEELAPETYAVMARLNAGEAVSAEEIDALKEVQEGRRALYELFEEFKAQHPELPGDEIDVKGTSALNTAERRELRNRIVLARMVEGSFSGFDSNGDEVYNGPVKKDRRMDIVIGLPASGKSSSIVNPMSEFYKSAVVDSDIIKKRLPEYGKGEGASLVHEESSVMNVDVLEGVLESGTNVVLPIVGSKANKVIAYIEQAKDYGYDVHVHLNELSSSKAIGRMLRRYYDDGRFIDPAHAVGYGDKPTEVYEEIRKRSDISGYSRWNNDVERGKRPEQREVSENNRAYAEYSGTWGRRGIEKTAGTESGSQSKDGASVYEYGTDNRGRQDTGRTADQPVRESAGEGRKSGGRDRRGNLGVSLGTVIPESTRKIMTEKGMPDVELEETTDRGAFSAALDAAKAANPNGGMVDSQSVEGLTKSKARTFMRNDGGAGVAVEGDGNIVGVFKNPEYKGRGVVYDLVLTALANGGTHLDCYSTYSHADLRTKYANLGFEPVCWLEFNREYAPEGWDYDAWGEPDVVLWRHNGDSVEQIVERTEKYHVPTRDEIHALPKFTDYDEAKAYQQKEVQKMLRERDRQEALRRVFRNAREIYGEGDEFVRRMDEDVKTKAGRERLSQVFRPQTEQARAEQRTQDDLRMQRERERERERRARMREAFKIEKRNIREDARAEKAAALITQKQTLDERWKARMDARIERIKEQAAEHLRIAKHKADVTRAFENESAKIREGKAKAEGRRKVAEERANANARMQEQRVLSRKTAKEARSTLSKARNTARPDYSNSEVDTLRKLPDKVESSKISELAQKLKSAGKRAYAAFVNQAQSIDNFAKKQSGGVKADTLVNAVYGDASTIETIYQEELVGRDGRRMGDSMKNTMLVWSEDGKSVDQDRQALLQDYMLHMHNIDRMSFTERALARVEEIEAANPWLVELDAKDFAYFAGLNDSETEATGTEARRQIIRSYADALRTLQEAKDKPIFADADGKSVSAETSRDKVAEYEAEHDWLKAKAESIYQWWDDFMNEWAVGSTLSAEEYAAWKNLYPHYVPTYRADESGPKPAVTVGGARAEVMDLFKGAKGSTKPVRNIEESFSMLVGKIVDTSRKNELLRNIIDTAMLDDTQTFSDFAIFDWDGFYEAYAENFMESSDWLGGDSYEQAEAHFKNAVEELDGGYRITAYNENGERFSAWVSKEMYRSLAAVTATSKLLGEGTNVLTRIGAKFTNPMKAMITGYNPHFAVRNAMRDLPTAIVNSVSGLAFPKYYGKAWAEMVRNSEEWKRFKALGGTHFGYYGMSVNWAERMGKSKSAAGIVKDKLGVVNESTESVTRFAEYLATLDKLGDSYESRLQGIKNAAEVTVDFSRKGEYGKLANAWIPYWNPAVQGIDKTIRQMFANGTTTKQKFAGAGVTLTRAALVAVLPEVLQYLMLKALDRYEDWEEVNDRMRDSYFLIPLKDENKFFKIPKTREWGTILGTPLMRILEGIEGRNDPFENYVEDALLANFSVAGIEDAIGLGTYIDLKTNKDFAGRSIVPYAYQEASPGLQYDSDTSAAAFGAAWVYNKTISKLAESIGLETELSPMQLDYIIGDYFGDFFNTIFEAMPIGLFNGEVSLEEASRTTLDALSGSWVGDSRYSNFYVGEYYDIMDYLEQGIADEKLMNPDDYKNSYIYKLDKAFAEAYGDTMAELNKNAATLPDGAEKDAVKEEISALAIEASEWFRNEMLNGSDDPFLRVSYGNFSTELQDALIELDEFSGVYHFKPSPSTTKSYTDPNNKNREYVLNDEHYEQYKTFYYEAYDEIMSKAVNSREYKSADAEERAELLDEARDEVHTKAKEELFVWLRRNGIESTAKEK